MFVNTVYEEFKITQWSQGPPINFMTNGHGWGSKRLTRSDTVRIHRRRECSRVDCDYDDRLFGVESPMTIRDSVSLSYVPSWLQEFLLSGG